MHPTFPADRTTGRRESVRVQANHGPDGQTVHHVYKFSAYPETSGDRKGPSHGVRETALKGETESTSGEAVRSSILAHGQVLQTPSMQVFPGLHCPFWAGTPLPPMTMCRPEPEPADEPPLPLDCAGEDVEPPEDAPEYE